MAQRRMFSRKITDSDTFTDMPLSAQCLYFHIAMAADDDGFVEGVNRIRRSIGASEDDLKLLFAKSFLIPFESGVVVVRQWHIHNYIQKDRYTPTTHTEELARLTVQETGEKGAYALIYEQITMPIGTTVSNPDTKCIQNGYRNGNAEAQRQTVKSPVNIGANKNVSRMDTDCIQNVSTGIGKGIDIDTGTGTKNDKKNTEEDNNIRRGRAGARAHTRGRAPLRRLSGHISGHGHTRTTAPPPAPRPPAPGRRRDGAPGAADGRLVAPSFRCALRARTSAQAEKKESGGQGFGWQPPRRGALRGGRVSLSSRPPPAGRGPSSPPPPAPRAGNNTAARTPARPAAPLTTQVSAPWPPAPAPPPALAMARLLRSGPETAAPPPAGRPAPAPLRSAPTARPPRS